MEAGIFLAVSGGIREAVRLYGEQAKVPPQVFLTGGDAGLLAQALSLDHPEGRPGRLAAGAVHWPNQTLEGILSSAEALP
jgi:hypothetical protein